MTATRASLRIMPNAANARITIQALNAMERGPFVKALGGILEHSPHFAERAWRRLPFADREELVDALWGEVDQASEGEQLALLRAHPDLANRMTALTAASSAEQKGAGLTELDDAELNEFQQLNREYWDRFGFPFIICARLNSRQTILRSFRERLHHSYVDEFQAALAEVGKIARLRLDDLIG